MNILQDLHRQRQTISHARDTLHGADDNISRQFSMISWICSGSQPCCSWSSRSEEAAPGSSLEN